MVSRIDEWWYQKQDGVTLPRDEDYKPITLPKNTPLGFLIGMASLVLGAALIWHIWWLAIVSFVAIVVFAIVRGMDDFAEYTIPAAEVMRMDKEARGL